MSLCFTDLGGGVLRFCISACGLSNMRKRRYLLRCLREDSVYYMLIDQRKYALVCLLVCARVCVCACVVAWVWYKHGWRALSKMPYTLHLTAIFIAWMPCASYAADFTLSVSCRFHKMLSFNLYRSLSLCLSLYLFPPGLSICLDIYMRGIVVECDCICRNLSQNLSLRQ